MLKLDLPPIITTNATPVVRKLYALEPQSIISLLFFITAIDTAGNAIGGQILRVVKRVGTGNAVLVGVVSGPGIQNPGALSWTAVLGVSGEFIVATLTGAAGVTINWNISGEGLLGQ